MSREDATPAEEACSQALTAFLQCENLTVTDLQLSDKPDLRLLANENPVAFECVQIPPSRVFWYWGARFKEIIPKGQEARGIKIVWPKEAHIWVLEAIADKESKFFTYRSNFPEGDINLIIHSPIENGWSTNDFINDSSINQIRWAAAKVKTQFKNIFFFNPNIGFERIYPSSSNFVEPVYDFTHGYPTSFSFRSTSGPITTTKEGEPLVNYDFGVMHLQVVIIKPEDDEFKKYDPHYLLERHRVTAEVGATTARFEHHLIDEADASDSPVKFSQGWIK